MESMVESRRLGCRRCHRAVSLDCTYPTYAVHTAAGYVMRQVSGGVIQKILPAASYLEHTPPSTTTRAEVLGFGDDVVWVCISFTSTKSGYGCIGDPIVVTVHSVCGWSLQPTTSYAQDEMIQDLRLRAVAHCKAIGLDAQAAILENSPLARLSDIRLSLRRGMDASVFADSMLKGVGLIS